MATDFDDVLAEAVALLRRLPRDPASVPEARAEVAQWVRNHPGTTAKLHAERAPSSLDVDYDLALGHDAEGVVGLTWQPSDGLPWLVRYADHWASNLVVTVNGRSTTVQQALLMLRVSTRAHIDLLGELVDQQLLLAAAEQHQIEPTANEIQEAADSVRRGLGLESATATLEWLQNMRLTDEHFSAIAKAVAQRRRLLERIATPDRIEQRFEAHPDAYARATVLIARVSSRDSAEELSADARSRDDLHEAVTAWLVAGHDAEATLTAPYARDVPAALREAPPGTITTAYPEEGPCAVAQLYGRAAPTLDEQTRARVARELVEERLGHERVNAHVEWHWT